MRHDDEGFICLDSDTDPLQGAKCAMAFGKVTVGELEGRWMEGAWLDGRGGTTAGSVSGGSS